MGFKVLVSIACVAIVAFVGVFFWDRHMAREERSSAERASVAQACAEARTQVSAGGNFEQARDFLRARCD